MNLSIIVAVAQNNVIGGNNSLLWHISADLKRFKALTTGHTVIMGRKTYESIGRPLPKRNNLIISNNRDFRAEGCTVFHSLDAALAHCANDDEVFVMGGGQIYRLALPKANKIYLTRVHRNFEGDTHFPNINPSEWRVTHEQPGVPNDEGLEYTFVDLERIK